MKKIFLVLPLFVALSLSVSAQRGMPQAMQKLLNAEYAISTLYVDSVNEDKLIEDAIKGMLENLDPRCMSSRPSPAVPASAWVCWRVTASSLSTTRSSPV